jgi:GNAT superfamily N-acetyltransferase
LNTELHVASQCYGLYDNDEIIGFFAVLNFPHPVLKNCITGHRLVILPDYQGIGLGHKFINAVAEIYVKQGYEFKATMSAKNLIAALSKDNNWAFVRYSKTAKKKKNDEKNWNSSIRSNVKTATFFYKKQKESDSDDNRKARQRQTGKHKN